MMAPPSSWCSAPGSHAGLSHAACWSFAHLRGRSPATQAWKRERLAAAVIAVPQGMQFVAVDFEEQALGEQLQSAGFSSTGRSFFSWLGVTPYLTEPAIFATLAWMAQLPGGAEVVFDYVNPAASVAPAGCAAHQGLAERVAPLGERFQSYFDTAQLCAKFSAAGFRHVEDLGPADTMTRFFPQTERTAPGRGDMSCTPPRSERRAQALPISHSQKFSPLSSSCLWAHDEITRLTALGPLPFLSGSTSNTKRCPSVRSFNPARSTAVM